MHILTRMARRSALTLLCGSLIATAGAPAANAADDLWAEKADSLQGRIHTVAHGYKVQIWDPDQEEYKIVARLRTQTDIHNPQPFVGFRATVGVNVIANNVVQRTFEHEAGACAILDPCGSDRFWTFDDVIPVGVMNRADRLEIYHVQR
jgi:hypothetical protein